MVPPRPRRRRVKGGLVLVALIGTGTIGQVHARMLADDPTVDPLVADLDERRATEVAAAVGATPRPLESVVHQDSALVIAAATEAHPALIRAGVTRGIPIFCETPLALDLAESYRLVAEIEASEVPFQLGFQRRFDTAYRDARRMVIDGELGTLYLVRLTANDHTPPPEAYIPRSGKVF